VLHARVRLEGTVRASPHLFTRTEEIDRLARGLAELTG